MSCYFFLLRVYKVFWLNAEVFAETDDGGQCVFSSEWDAQAQKTYFANYGEVPFGDITSEQTENGIISPFS